MSIEVIIAIAISAANLVWIVYSWRSKSRNLNADTYEKMDASLNGALDRITILEEARVKDHAEIDRLKKENATKDEQISLQQAEITILKTQLNRMNRELLQLKKDTGELRTPPPHNIPKDWNGDPPNE